MTSDQPPESPVVEPVPWPEGWPAAQIGGLTTVRLMVLPGPPGEPAEDPQAWQLTAAGTQEEQSLHITGEMIRVCGRFFLTVAARASIQFAPGAAPPMVTDDQLDGLLLRYGPWVSHVLWDYCRVVLLQASSAFAFRPALEIPVSTPEPKCITHKTRQELKKRRSRKPDADDEAT